MKTFAIYYLLIGLATASTLRSVQYGGTHRLLNRRSQEQQLSLYTEAYMNDIVANVTALFHDSHVRRLQSRSFDQRPSLTQRKDIPNIVDRAPVVATATTVKIPDDLAPPGTEWDESFQDVTARDKKAKNLSVQRAALKTAWDEAMRMAGLSQNGLKALNQAVSEQNFDPNDVNGPKNFIAHSSPPMAQIFGSLPDSVGPVQEVFDRIVNVVSDVTGGNRKGNILRLAYGDEMRRLNGKNKVCGAKSSNSNAFWASTYPPDQTGGVPNDLQKKYQIADSMIVFCPTFFDINLPSDIAPLPNDADALAAHARLDGLRTKGQTVLHEWAHLPWIQSANSNPTADEVYGFQEVAQLFQNEGTAVVMNNADSFAVFASYHAYNQETWAPSDPRPNFGCKDVWPQTGGSFNPAKPVPDTFS